MSTSLASPFAPVSDDDAPILLELRLRLDATTDPADQAALRMRQALYLARTERLVEAKSVPALIRAEWAGREDLKVYVWLWILEGVLGFYGTSRAVERQRLLQAHAAAEPAGLRAEAQLASAWLAHLAYVDGDVTAMLRWLSRSALGTASLDETVARSTLTLACALQWFGEESLAASWFSRAREVARRTGDRAGMMAATANRAMLRLHDNWLAHAFGRPARHPMAPLRQELLGILGYEQLSGSSSLLEQNEIARLRLAVLDEQGSQAASLTQTMVAARERHSRPALLEAQVVQLWMQAKALPPEEAARHLHAATAALDLAGLDDDDAAACCCLLASAARHAGRQATAQHWQAQADAAVARDQAKRDPHRPALLALEEEAQACWPG